MHEASWQSELAKRAGEWRVTHCTIRCDTSLMKCAKHYSAQSCVTRHSGDECNMFSSDVSHIAQSRVAHHSGNDRLTFAPSTFDGTFVGICLIQYTPFLYSGMLPSSLCKLFTKEDPMHLHKTLGLLVLSNFIYRFYLLFFYGTMRLNTPIALGMSVMHGALSISSLVFHIPQKRHATLPMIYPEFRFHSILFGLRSVACCFVEHYTPVYLKLYCKGLVCFLTMMLADMVTMRHAAPGDTTMRGMPFAESIPEHECAKITRFHSRQQISATIFMLWSMETAFSPLFAIQLAALLMTLVRKGFISPNTWHLLYSWSLMVNVFSLRTLPVSQLLLTLFATWTFRVWRMHLRLNKYAGWSLVFAVIVLCDWTWLDKHTNAQVGWWLSSGLVASYLLKNLYAVRCLYMPEAHAK
jgi:hypothetical protein